MGAQRIPAPISVEEYERVPDPPGGRYELHHGELAFVTWPVHQHKVLQRRLRELLEPAAKSKGFIVDTEYPYRPLPENEVWGADVVCIERSRDQAIKKWLLGSPELVIQVKSPSNTKAELNDKAMTTLAGEGSLEFWIVDPERCIVTVHSKNGMHVYGAGQDVPVPVTGTVISVDELFSGCE